MPNNPDYLQEPTYWFVILDRAVVRGDSAAVAHAQRELSRLGVEVTIDPEKRRAVAGAPA